VSITTAAKAFGDGFWVPAPLRTAFCPGGKHDRPRERFVLAVHAKDPRYMRGPCIVCTIPLRRTLSEGGVLDTLHEYFPEVAWSWDGERSRFVGSA
jgi:hypothetical protein